MTKQSAAMPLVHGHRGARGRRPENTLEAVKFAIDCGADGVEVDLCVSADDAVVVHHDLTIAQHLTRSAGGNWIDDDARIRSLTLEQLLTLDVGRLKPGTDYAARFQQQEPRDGESIPSLHQFLEFVMSHCHERFVFNLELKGSPTNPSLLPEPVRYVELVLDAVSHYGIETRTFLQSFDWQLARLAKQSMPTLKVGLLTDSQPDAAPHVPDSGNRSLWTDGFRLEDHGGSVPDLVQAAGGDVWSSNFLDLTPALVDRAHSLGLDVYVWTVNEPDEMRKMIDYGVDVITTDYPDRLVALLNKINR